MKVSADIQIAAPVEKVWASVTDIENCANHISGITHLEVLHRPESGLVGFKWRETRVMFGKEASEDMWIVAAVPNEYYETNSESHGTRYTSRISLARHGDGTTLKMSFNGEAQTAGAKIMSALMGVFMKPSLVKCLRQDLVDIKQHLEEN